MQETYPLYALYFLCFHDGVVGYVTKVSSILLFTLCKKRILYMPFTFYVSMMVLLVMPAVFSVQKIKEGIYQRLESITSDAATSGDERRLDLSFYF